MFRPEAPVSGQTERKPVAISDYQLIRQIGSGAYGEVWLARGVTGVLRAVKIVRRDRFGSAEPFEREFRGLKEFAAISLVADNQLALLHIGQNQEEGFFYYVMELADDINTGRDIDIDSYQPCSLSALQRKAGRLATEEAIRVGVELARGLASLHAHGLVHRDIKPANIIFVGGMPKLADIGLVSAAELGQSIIGTEGFIAPEGPGTAAADVYSAGKVLYELNTGQDRKQFPVLPHEFHPAVNHRQFLNLNEVVLRACEGNASRRYQTATELLEDLVALQAGRGLLGRRVTRWLSPFLFRLTIGLAIVVSAVGGAWLWPKIAPHQRIVPNSINPRSVAVLPFANLSPEPAYAFFADGIHGDVIARLSKIRDLKVISRTSVAEYKAGKREPRAIAARLGVAHIVEGTVQREGTRVRVTIRMKDARTDRTIWSSHYDKDNLTDMLSSQNALAQEIAMALRAELTPTERELIARRPTTNSRAYDLYLQARNTFQEVGWSRVDAKDTYERTIALCEEAIAEDASFAEPFVQLSLARSALYRYSVGDPSAEQLVKAKLAANSATGWGPNLPEARLARGIVLYLDRKDWPGALDEFLAAEINLPNDDQLQWWKGNVLRRLGHWDAAVRCFDLAATLNPRVPDGAANAIQTRRYLRQFKEALTLARAQARLFPDNRRLHEEVARCQLEMDGDRATFLRQLESMPEDKKRPSEATLITRQYESAYRRNDWEAADRALTEKALQNVAEFPLVVAAPVALHRALVAFLSNRRDVARTFAAQALEEAKVGEEKWTERTKPWALMVQARAHALLGNATEAMVASDSAWKSVTDAGDKTEAVPMLTRRGEVLIMLGQNDRALSVLREMMTQPAELGPEALRMSPLWRRLAGDPRFEQILQSAKPLRDSSSDNLFRAVN